MIHFIAPFYLFYSIVDNTSGAIRGSGESLRPMLLTVIGTVVFRVAWLLVVVPLHHTLQTMLLGLSGHVDPDRGPVRRVSSLRALARPRRDAPRSPGA